MAKIAYDRKRKRWQVSFKNGLKRIRRFFRFKINALDLLAKLQVKEERKRNELETSDFISLREAITAFDLEYLSMRSETYRTSERRRLNQLAHRFEGKSLEDLDQETINRFVVERLQGGASHKTILNDLAIVSSLFNWAVDRKFVQENPVVKVKRLGILPRRKRRALSDDEIKRILARSCPCCFPMFAILVNTGIRVGELRNLRKEDFDLERHVLHVRHTEETPVKGKKDRFIPVNQFIEGIVVLLPEGKILRRSYWSLVDHFRGICKQVNVTACLHELRHTYVTKLVQSGVDLLTAKEISGHSDIATLQKYLHGSIGDVENLRNRVVFSVPSGCQRLSFDRSKAENLAPYGHGHVSKNQILKKYQRPINASPTGFEPVVSNRNIPKSKVNKSGGAPAVPQSRLRTSK